jgi:hypothetical protein
MKLEDSKLYVILSLGDSRKKRRKKTRKVKNKKQHLKLDLC